MTNAPFPRGSLYVVSFTLASGGGMVFSLLARLQDEYGFATSGLGLLTAVSFIAAPIASIGFAGYADRGYTRRLVVAALSLGTAGALLFALGSSLWQFVLARAMIGFGFGLYQPTSRGLIIRDARAGGGGAGEALAKLSGIETAGFTVGPGIGAALVYVAGLRAPFLCVACLLPIAATGLLRRMPTVPSATSATSATKPTLTFDLLRLPRVRVAVLLAVGNFLPVGIYDALWARYLQDRGATTLFVGLSLSLYGIPYVLAAPFGGRLVDRVGSMRAMRIAVVGVVPLVVAYGMIGNIWVIAFLALAEAGFGAIAQPAAQSAMAAACPADRLAAGQGLAGASASLTAAATALVAAPLYAEVGSVGVFSGAAAAVGVIMFTAIVLGTRLDRSDGRTIGNAVTALPG